MTKPSKILVKQLTTDQFEALDKLKSFVESEVGRILDLYYLACSDLTTENISKT